MDNELRLIHLKQLYHILLNPNAIFRVNRVEKSGGCYWVYIDENTKAYGYVSTHRTFMLSPVLEK